MGINIYKVIALDIFFFKKHKLILKVYNAKHVTEWYDSLSIKQSKTLDISLEKIKIAIDKTHNTREREERNEHTPPVSI